MNLKNIELEREYILAYQSAFKKEMKNTKLSLHKKFFSAIKLDLNLGNLKQFTL